MAGQLQSGAINATWAATQAVQLLGLDPTCYSLSEETLLQLGSTIKATLAAKQSMVKRVVRASLLDWANALFIMGLVGVSVSILPAVIGVAIGLAPLVRSLLVVLFLPVLYVWPYAVVVPAYTLALLLPLRSLLALQLCFALVLYGVASSETTPTLAPLLVLAGSTLALAVYVYLANGYTRRSNLRPYDVGSMMDRALLFTVFPLAVYTPLAKVMESELLGFVAVGALYAALVACVAPRLAIWTGWVGRLLVEDMQHNQDAYERHSEMVRELRRGEDLNAKGSVSLALLVCSLFVVVVRLGLKARGIQLVCTSAGFGFFGDASAHALAFARVWSWYWDVVRKMRRQELHSMPQVARHAIKYTMDRTFTMGCGVYLAALAVFYNSPALLNTSFVYLISVFLYIAYGELGHVLGGGALHMLAVSSVLCAVAYGLHNSLEHVEHVHKLLGVTG